MTGAVSGVVVLDVDPRNGGDAALAELEDRLGALPPTVEARTGGGGRHLWFRAPERPLASRTLAPGLDLKGEGGMVVVPPSIHVSGRRYEWVPGHEPDALALGAAPTWFVEPPGGGIRSGSARPSTIERTPSERGEFAALWARAGVTVTPGDHQYLCPFHADHHPSLHIDADGCRWYCFGCREGGGAARLRRLVGVPAEPAARARVTAVRGLPRPGAVSLAGDETVDVVGESRHQDALLALTGGQRHHGGVDVLTTAHLEPDPQNPVDPLAIAVVIDGRRVGWLSRADAARYRSLVVAACSERGEATCAARIRGGWDRGAGDVGRFGVVLSLPTLNRG